MKRFCFKKTLYIFIAGKMEIKSVIALVMVFARSSLIGKGSFYMYSKYLIYRYKPNKRFNISSCKNVFCFNTVESLNDKVICPGEAKTEIVQCGHNEIIDINSVTTAYIENWNPCTEEYIVPIIGDLPKTCKSSRKLDVAEVYER